MYTISKVKRWIKKAAKTDLSYNKNEQLISDNYVIIRVLPEMLPAILEAFGHLNGGRTGTYQSKEAYQMGSYMTPGPLQVIDSKLKYSLVKPKREHRILYLQDSGQKIIIDAKYADLFNDFEACSLAATKNGTVQVFWPKKVIGAIASIRCNDSFLDTFRFILPANISTDKNSDQKGRKK